MVPSMEDVGREVYHLREGNGSGTKTGLGLHNVE